MSLKAEQSSRSSKISGPRSTPSWSRSSAAT